MQAGVARGLITPAIGSSMAGFSHRWFSSGVHDELRAQALVIGGDAGAVELVWICCDLLSVPGFVVDRICERLAAAHGIAREQIVVSASHNHYASPVDSSGEALAVVVDAAASTYGEHFVNVVVGLAGRAISSLRPCRIRYGAGTTHIGVNRRQPTESGIVLGQNPHGPIDRTLRLVRIDGADGTPIAAVVHAACHCVSLGAEFAEISADFPGVMRECVEASTGAEVLFVQGCAGDINPVLMEGSWSSPVRLGQRLAADALDVYYGGDLETIDVSRIRSIRREVDLAPWQPRSVLEAEEELRQLSLALTEARRAGGGDPYWDEWRCRKLARALDAARSPGPLTPVRCALSGIALGPTLVIATVPGELFTELGLQIQASSPFETTMVSGYSNGSIDYIPTATAYDEGGYEISDGCRLAAGEGEHLASEVASLLADLYRLGVRD